MPTDLELLQHLVWCVADEPADAAELLMPTAGQRCVSLADEGQRVMQLMVHHSAAALCIAFIPTHGGHLLADGDGQCKFYDRHTLRF